MNINPSEQAFVAGAKPSHQTALAPPTPTPWRRLWSHPRMIQYHRWFALVVVVNAIVAFKGSMAWGWWDSAEHVALIPIAKVMLANFALSILIRQQYVVNALFRLATSAPTTWPLAVRWQLAKVYHFGGLHTGGATSGSFWFAVLLGSQLWHINAGGTAVSTLTLLLGAALMLMLVAIIATALPGYRAKKHNHFEKMHRFGGWTALLLFWAHTTSTMADGVPAGQSLGDSLRAPSEWWSLGVLALLTFSVILPWLRLKRVKVEIVKPSNHALVVRYNYGDNAFPGSSNTVSLNPLTEWHSFANIPTPGEDGYRHIISRAGDWTGALIDNPPKHLWVKGITTGGVANIEVLFKKVVYVATGSGIGPVLPHLLAHKLPIHLLWATRNPRKTYGDALVDEILRACPDAHIWDTDTLGKPDLVAMALESVRRTGAEAVICIANTKLTQQVIRGVELQGIPGYGAIWDS